MLSEDKLMTEAEVFSVLNNVKIEDVCVNSSLPECKGLEHPHKVEPIELRIVRMEKRIEEIHAMMVKTDDAVAQIVEQVKPTLDELSKSPILKMLGMKK